MVLAASGSTIGIVIKDNVGIMGHVKGSAPVKASIITKQHSGLIIEMERLFLIWLEDQNTCNAISLVLM